MILPFLTSSSPRIRFGKCGLLAISCLCLGQDLFAVGADAPNAGPLLSKFDLTLFEGRRTEALGPLFYSEQKESQTTWAVPPLFLHTSDPTTESEELDLVYPFLTLDRFGSQYRWQVLQLFSISGGGTQHEKDRDRFTLFPVYFQQRSSDPTENYTALFPLYGRLKHRLFRDDIFFVMFPCFSETRNKDVVTDNYLYPIFHKRRGDGLTGWQVWPVIGAEHKGVTTRTNGFNETEVLGGHDSRFFMWPFFVEDKSGIGTENPLWQQGSLPAYNFERSPRRDSTTVLWPLFTVINDRENKYREWELPWPIIVVARGEGKTTTRFFPFYSRAHSSILESDFYLWPVYKYNRAHSDPLDRKRARILLFLYSDTSVKNTETGATERLVDLFPFFRMRREFDGSSRLQVLSLLEPFVMNNKSIERDYSPLWSFWRSERNARTGASSQSLLWNLYRHESSPAGKKCSLVFGLFQYQSGAEGKTARLFYLPLAGKKPAASHAMAGGEKTGAGGQTARR